MNSDVERDAFPQSMRHKQILDVAEENPDASIDDVASMVASATPDLVERVFDEYGDPASGDDPSTESAEGTISATGGVGATSHGDADTTTHDDVTGTSHGDTDATAHDDVTATTDGGPGAADPEGAVADGEADPEAGADRYPSPDDLSERQREVLAEIAARPTATQAEIGDRLDVSRATVSNRVNGVDGFEWSDRESFVEHVFEDEAPSPVVAGDGGPTAGAASAGSGETDGTQTPPGEGSDSAGTVADVEETLARLEARVHELEETLEGGTDDSAFEDPELVHKIVHACVNSEAISEAEELRILRELVG
jgi:DNA-binding CsgD family transcriptional regulator